ncbi:MAG: hypothetical protein QOE63_171 [Acidimicrobiaceae bacterium]
MIPACFVRRRGEGALLVLVHGVAGSALIWSDVVDRLADRYELLAVDLLGYGHSPKPRIDYTADAHIAAIHNGIAPIVGERPVVLVGLSMGSLLALTYAASGLADVRGIVALGAPYYRDEAEARLGLRANAWTSLCLRAPLLARPLINVTWGLGRRSRWLSTRMRPAIYAPEIARETMMATYHAFSSSTREVLVQARIEPLLDATSSIPKLFVHGTADPWCPAERIEELVRDRSDCTLTVLEGIGHNLAVLEPARVAALLSAFTPAP